MAYRNQGVTFNGSGYLPLAGGTMTGGIRLANVATALNTATGVSLQEQSGQTVASGQPAFLLDTVANYAATPGTVLWQLKTAGTEQMSIFSGASPAIGLSTKSAIAFDANVVLFAGSGGVAASAVPLHDAQADLGTFALRWTTLWSYSADILTSISGSNDFVLERNVPSGPGSVGYSMAVQSGSGQAADNAVPGGNAGLLAFYGGDGGAASVAQDAGAGARGDFLAGRGGDGGAATSGGAGGGIVVDAGRAGADNGGGTGTAGTIVIGTTYASGLTIGRSGVTTEIDGTLRYDNFDNTARSTLITYLVINVNGTPRYVPVYDT